MAFPPTVCGQLWARERGLSRVRHGLRWTFVDWYGRLCTSRCDHLAQSLRERLRCPRGRVRLPERHTHGHGGADGVQLPWWEEHERTLREERHAWAATVS